MRQENGKKEQDTLETANELNNYLFARTKRNHLINKQTTNIKR